MKKIRIIILLAFITLLAACGKKITPKTMSLGGVEYDSKFVRSGYYFDKASLSEAVLGEMLSRVEVIEKPENLGEVVLPNFSEIELTNNKKVEITDADIEAEIEKERDTETVYNKIKEKRATKLKDKVIIDFKGFIDGKEFDGGSMEDCELVLGSNQFIPGFEEKIVGHKAGQKFTIDVTFPNEYVEELAGKDAKFDITIKSIEEADTPEVNEEFVARHTTVGSKTVSEYKDEIKKRIEDRMEFMNNQNLIYQFYDKAIMESKFNPSEEALAWQFSVLLNQFSMQATQMGSDIVTMLTQNGGSLSDSFDELKSSIPQYIEPVMLIDELKKKYNVSITEADVKKWFTTMSEAMGYGNTISYDDYVKQIGYEMLKESALQEKVILAAAKSCKLVDEEASE